MVFKYGVSLLIVYIGSTTSNEENKITSDVAILEARKWHFETWPFSQNI